jgi:23S rRNA (cytidine1920-2'-O)/16S rRNA (cytidine1409-2'-O)-methyltransferase
LKERADVLLVNKKLAPSREKARALIMAGLAYAGERRIEKAGMMVDSGAEITLRGAGEEYVGRGGKKLAKAVEAFGIKLDGLVCADIGAATGGFTDCMLQNSAARVYAIDVGYGQLAWKLRNDPRVINIERANIRYVTPAQLPEPLDFFSADVSFISLGLVLPAVTPFLAENAFGVCLIKPQFEAGRGRVGKNGVVRDSATHIEVIERFFDKAAQNGLSAGGLSFSPIKGPKGNIEFLALVTKPGPERAVDIAAAVEHAHASLL